MKYFWLKNFFKKYFFKFFINLKCSFNPQIIPLDKRKIFFITIITCVFLSVCSPEFRIETISSFISSHKSLSVFHSCHILGCNFLQHWHFLFSHRDAVSSIDGSFSPLLSNIISRFYFEMRCKASKTVLSLNNKFCSNKMSFKNSEITVMWKSEKSWTNSLKFHGLIVCK